MERRDILDKDDPARWNALHRPPGTMQVVFGFEENQIPKSYEAADRFHRLYLHVYCPFRPLGLFLSGTTNEGLVRNVRCGNQAQGNDHPIPAAFFATHRSFAELREMARRGELSPSPERILEMDELNSGNMFSFEMRGPLAGACVWGLIYRQGDPPCERVEVERNTSGGEGYQGKVIRTTLRGSEIAFEAAAPTEEGVYQLLDSQRRARPAF